jgi:CubicO group peptidase (beta-lactamase class C family)
MQRVRRCFLGLILSVLGVAESAPGSDVGQKGKSEGLSPEAIDALVQGTLKDWRVPGVALAIVYRDRLVYLKGHGVREQGRPGAVTADTVFPIASCTKPFTSLAIGMLVTDGKMAWDDPVRKHIPFFRLADPLADAKVTIRDLLAHRTGVGSHDLLWYKAPWGLEERIRKVAALELEDSFRARFHYQAILFGAAGYAAGKAAGSDWAELVQSRILTPLGMKSSAPVFHPEAPDLATPHRRDREGKLVSMSRYALDKPDPAGSLHSTARDLSQLLRFELADGAWNGRRLIAAEALAERRNPQMVIPRDGFARVMNPGTVQISCGLGWIVQDYHGRLLLQHGGAIDGFRSHLALVPEAKLGIAILSNLDRGFMNLALSNTLIDRFLELPRRDWSRYFLDVGVQGEAEEKARADKLRAARKRGTKPTVVLEAYTGRYHDAAYGTCEVVLRDGRLTWLWGNWDCPLAHYENDVFLTDAEGMQGPVEFQLDKDGKVSALKIVGRLFKRVF